MKKALGILLLLTLVLLPLSSAKDSPPNIKSFGLSVSSPVDTISGGNSKQVSIQTYGFPKFSQWGWNGEAWVVRDLYKKRMMWDYDKCDIIDGKVKMIDAISYSDCYSMQMKIYKVNYVKDSKTKKMIAKPVFSGNQIDVAPLEYGWWKS